MQSIVLGQPADTAATPWSVRIAASALKRYTLSESRWRYTDGLLFKGIHRLWQLTGDEQYWQCLAAYVDRYVDASGQIGTYRPEEYNIDQIKPGTLLFPLYQATNQARYRQAIWLLREQLRGYPRTHEGGFWHKQIYPFQMWLDGIYMGSPFYTEFAATFDEPDAFDDIAFQIITIEKHTKDPRTGLLYHGWDESRQQRWADPVSGCSPHFWSRAIGWYTMALVDVLDHFPPEHAARPEIIAILERTLTAVARVNVLLQSQSARRLRHHSLLLWRTGHRLYYPRQHYSDGASRLPHRSQRARLHYLLPMVPGRASSHSGHGR